jgi:hypothetical protein
MNSQDEILYTIGNADEEFIERFLKIPYGLGGAYKEKWCISIPRCVRLIPSYLWFKEKLKKLTENYAKNGNLEEYEKVYKKLAKEAFKKASKGRKVNEEECFKETINFINRAVVEEVIHAYGNVSHRERYVILYKQKDRDEISKILADEKVNELFKVEEKVYSMPIKGFQGEFILTAKKFEAEENKMKYLIKFMVVSSILMKRNFKFEFKISTEDEYYIPLEEEPTGFHLLLKKLNL